MLRAWLAVSASMTAIRLGFVLIIGAAGSNAWAGAGGEASGNEGLLHVAPLDPRHGESTVLRVEAVEDLGFGKIVADAARGGEVVVDPATGLKTVRGGAHDLGGYHSRAEFIVRGKPNSGFAILLPDRIKLAGKQGQVMMTKLTSSPDHYGRIGPNGVVTVFVGATLDLHQNSPTGQFQGPFSVLLDPR